MTAKLEHDSRIKGSSVLTTGHHDELESILSKSPVIVFLWRAEKEWPVEYVSENIKQFGYLPEDFYSSRIPYAQIVHPDDLHKVGMEVQTYSAESARTEFTQEYRIITSTGEVRWIDDRTYIRRNAVGKITHYQGIIVDITSRKKAEERLEKLNECFLAFGSNSEENINRLVALCGELMNAACALYNYLDEGTLSSVGKWNIPPGLRLVDKPDGHLCYDVIRQGGDHPFVVRNLQQTSYAESDPNVRLYGLQTYVGQAVRRGGKHIGSLCVVYQKDFMPSKEDNEFISVIASAIGVEEERRQAEEESEEIKRQQKAILNSIPDIAWLKDCENHYIAVNEPFAAACGKQPEEIAGKTDLDIWPEDLAAKYGSDDAEIIDTGKRKITEELIELNDGIRTWVETVKTPIFNEAGKVTATSGIARDITERKRIQNELQKRAFELQEAKDIAEKSALELAKVVKEISAAKQELERFNSAAVGREMRIIEMKKEVNALLSELGREPKYKMAL